MSDEFDLDTMGSGEHDEKKHEESEFGPTDADLASGEGDADVDLGDVDPDSGDEY